MVDFQCKNRYDWEDLIEIIRILRAPGGCPWDAEQTHRSIRREFLEETYEVLDAMDRDDARQSLGVIQDVTKEVMAGRNYVIFPEGTRSREGNKIQEFHGGSFRAAVKAKCPVVPVAVVDTHKVFDTKGSGTVSCQLHYLPPILPEEYAGMKANDLAELVKARIEEVVKANS